MKDITGYDDLKDLANRINSSDPYDISRPWGDLQIGLRVVAPGYDDYDAKIGDILEKSYVWEDGNQTDDFLPGTCAIDPAKIDLVRGAYYSGRRILVLTSEDAEVGNDPAEIIMINPIVVDVINLD